jgi:hypothetical protein
MFENYSRYLFDAKDNCIWILVFTIFKSPYFYNYEMVCNVPSGQAISPMSGQIFHASFLGFDCE